ncbi:hypothetical protein GCM10022267_74960 [Lentzea roselyniae]|uniref:Uncharacterized protein n=1 Tax=Lentzea roselyniae TaxID=531940 RepID=A0ABP7C1Z3_9PSEU
MTRSTSGRERPSFSKAYSFVLVTFALFLLSWIGQFISQVIEVGNSAAEHGSSFSWSEFFPQFLSATLENWQSEFLQLMWQVVGLAFLYAWGSSQSRESDDRLEAKIDALLQDRGIDSSAINTEIRDRVQGRTTQDHG